MMRAYHLSSTTMESDPQREKFDTALKRIGHEIKSRLVLHGLFGTVNYSEVPDGTRVEIQAQGRIAARSFERQQIEGCCLRVGGAVLAGIIAMVDELARAPGSAAEQG
jgi:hypothetical protein